MEHRPEYSKQVTREVPEEMDAASPARAGAVARSRPPEVGIVPVTVLVTVLPAASNRPRQHASEVKFLR